MAPRKDTTIYFDEASRARLDRLVAHDGNRADVIREALLQLELHQSYTRDQVRNAVLAVAAAEESDGQYDPADDPRPEQAVSVLAERLGSLPAAEGVQLALRQLWLRNTLHGAGDATH